MLKPAYAVRLPARDGIREEARESLALLRGCRQTINVVLVALTDGVELEVWADDRLAARLARRGYRRGLGPS